MPKFTSRADLLIAAGESIKMQQAAGITPVCKNIGHKVDPMLMHFNVEAEYEFPLAVVEGKAVFVGDELWNVPNNFKFTAERIYDVAGDPCIWNNGTNGSIGGRVRDLSWNKPKPKTVMVELLRDEVECLASYNGRYDYYINIANKCSIALEAK